MIWLPEAHNANYIVSAKHDSQLANLKREAY